MDLNLLYENSIRTLEQSGVNYKEYEHEAIFSYEKGKEVMEEFGMKGVESKSLFLKSKDGRYLMFVSAEGRRVDTKLIKKLIGSKVSICSGDELTEITGCLPGCAIPFGLPKEIILLVDRYIFGLNENYFFSPGPPEKTIEIHSSDIEKILSVVENEVLIY